jgi:hypothetical protein
VLLLLLLPLLLLLFLTHRPHCTYTALAAQLAN